MNKEELAKFYYDVNAEKAQHLADTGNFVASGIMKAAEWALAGLLHGGKKGLPIAPMDEWEGELTKPSTWDLDPGDQYGPIDFWKSWKPDLADIPGELAHFLRPFRKGAPQWGEEWSKEHDFYLGGSSGDQFGLAGVGNFEKNQDYSELQNRLVNSSPEELDSLGYIKLVPNPIYKNISPDDFSNLMANIPDNQFDFLGASKEQWVNSVSSHNPFIPENLYNAMNEWGLNIPEDQKKSGFYISNEDFNKKIMVDRGDGVGVETTPYNEFIQNVDHNIARLIYDEYGKIDSSLMDRVMDNPLLWSSVARQSGIGLGGNMNSVIMDTEDKSTNFSHDKFMDASMFLGPEWNWEDQSINPMAITAPPMMSESLPVVGEMLEGGAEDEGIINEFKRKVGLGDFKPGTMFMDLMHEQYPFGDPKYIEELKKDLEETGREPTGIENLAMYFPEAMALVGGGKMKFPRKIMETPFSPWNVFTPHHVLPYSKKTPVGIYRDIQESIPKFEKEKEMEIPILFTVDREGNKIQ